MTAEQSPQLHPRIEELIEFLGEHRRGVYEAVAAVPASLRDRRPASDRWSVAEVLEHLSIIEQRVARLLSMRVTAARASGIGPDPETSSVVSSYPNPTAVVDRTTKFDSPAPVLPTGTLDSAAGTQALVQAHAAMVSSLQNASGTSLETLMQPHPVFGPLNLYHFIVALGLHDKRHAAQIREIGESLSAT